MKKGIFLTLLIATVMAVSPLKAQFSIGPGVVYGTEIESLGLQGVVAYDFADRFGAMAGYTYFFEKDNIKWSAIDVDATYSIYSMEERGSVYALAGVNFLTMDLPVLGNSNSTGLNLGVGWKIGMGTAMTFVPEVRYTLGDADYLRVGVKLMFGL